MVEEGVVPIGLAAVDDDEGGGPEAKADDGSGRPRWIGIISGRIWDLFFADFEVSVPPATLPRVALRRD